MGFFYRNYGISAKTKLLATLRFYATGSFYMMIGDFVGISAASLSKFVLQVSEAIAKLRPKYINMPRNDEERRRNFTGFMNIAGFPNVIGTIDCTHVKIIGQGGQDGEAYRNRKQFFSLNVQSVANFDLSFQDVVARWPGSTHDSHIFGQSDLKKRFVRGEFHQGILLGDGGYKLETYMMTPFRNPQSQAENSYNQKQILTRNTVERKYGVWKRRFPCLAFGLRCKQLRTSQIIIVACAVLHNFCIQQKEPDLPFDEEIEQAVREMEMQVEDATADINRRTANINRQANFKRNSFAEMFIA